MEPENGTPMEKRSWPFRNRGCRFGESSRQTLVKPPIFRSRYQVPSVAAWKCFRKCFFSGQLPATLGNHHFSGNVEKRWGYHRSETFTHEAVANWCVVKLSNLRCIIFTSVPIKYVHWSIRNKITRDYWHPPKKKLKEKKTEIWREKKRDILKVMLTPLLQPTTSTSFFRMVPLQGAGNTRPASEGPSQNHEAPGCLFFHPDFWSVENIQKLGKPFFWLRENGILFFRCPALFFVPSARVFCSECVRDLEIWDTQNLEFPTKSTTLRKIQQRSKPYDPHYNDWFIRILI